MLGTAISAHILSTIYLWFLPLVPLALTAWLIWSRNISYGYWFATSQCIAWTLGTASYYALPTLGPGFEYSWLYATSPTPAADLMDALYNGRDNVLFGGVEGAVQSVAGFASLHCAITLLVALMVQYTIRSRVLHWISGSTSDHRRRHPLLRLALRRRRHRRHRDRAHLLLRRRHRHRAEVRPARALLATPRPPPRPSPSTPTERRSVRIVHDETVASSARTRTFVVDYPDARELQACSSSSRHAGDGEKIGKTVSFVTESISVLECLGRWGSRSRHVALRPPSRRASRCRATQPWRISRPGRRV